MLDWKKHAHGSPLYDHLVGVIAGDPELMGVINRIQHTPRPNMLFAGVQYLLFLGAGPDLAPYYPSITADPLPPEFADESFRSFVLDHEAELVDIGRTRYTQTNECRRCVALLPMVWEAPFDSFHLIDVGTSAGLNLAIDRYRYRWGDVEWGSGDGVLLTAGQRGRQPSPRDIAVLGRIGLDLNPVDHGDPDERTWLDALIWPEHVERRERLRAALDHLSGLDLDLIAGDALETLAEVLSEIPDSEPAVVMNSFTLIQFTDHQRVSLEEITDSARGRRPVHRVSMEVSIGSDDWARLIVNDGSGERDIGQAHPHGEWVELYSD